MLRLAITGGLGSGKSTVSQFLREAGCPVLDADAIGRELLRGELRPALLAAFGPAILDPQGVIRAASVAELVFAPGADAALQTLNGILHPAIMEAARRQLLQFESEGVRMAGLEAALLIEAGLLAGFDHVLLVVCEADERVRRYAARTGATPAQARARMARQWPDQRKLADTDAVVDNNGSRDATRSQVLALMGQWQKQLPREAQA